MAEPEPASEASRLRRSLLRKSIFVALWIAALLVIRLIWGAYASHALNAEIAAARARGEPVTIDDFNAAMDANGRGLDDDQNAATFLKNAALALVPMTPEQSRFENSVTGIGSEQTPRGWKIIESVASQNRSALAIVRRATGLTRRDWKLHISSPVFNLLLPDLNAQRDLANTLAYAVVANQHTGNDGEAIECIRAQLHQAEIVEDYSPVMITHLVATGMVAMASASVERVVGDLKIDSSASKPGPATPEQVRRLIRELLDDANFRAHGVSMFHGDRLIAIDFILNDPTGFVPGAPLLNRWLLWPVRPMFRADAIRLMHANDAMSQAIGQPTLPQARSAKPPEPVRSPGLLATTPTYASLMFDPVNGRILASQFHVLTDRRAAAVRLAWRLFKVEHGKPPTSLEELVPNELPAIPVDPMSPSAMPLKFVANGEPAIYSVGEDGVDDGGSTTRMPQYAKRLNGDRFESVDAVYMLRPKREPAPADDSWDIDPSSIFPGGNAPGFALPTSRPQAE